MWNLFSCSCCCLIFCVSFQVIPSLSLHEVDLQVILYLCRLQLGWNAWCWHPAFFPVSASSCFFWSNCGSQSYIWMCKQVNMYSTNRLCYIFFWDIHSMHCFHANFYSLWFLYACHFANHYNHWLLLNSQNSCSVPVSYLWQWLVATTSQVKEKGWLWRQYFSSSSTESFRDLLGQPQNPCQCLYFWTVPFSIN